MDLRDWSDAFANDLDRRPAIVTWVPRHLADITIEDVAAAYHNCAQQALDDVTKGTNSASVAVKTYQIGPTAEWSQTLLVVLSATPLVISVGADLMTWAEVGQRAIVKMRRWLDDRSDHTSKILGLESKETTYPVLTLPIVLGLCLTHFCDCYGELDTAAMDWYVRVSSPLGSARHPAGQESYTVRILSRRTHYFWIVRASGQVTDHFSITGSRMTARELPDWLIET